MVLAQVNMIRLAKKWVSNGKLLSMMRLRIYVAVEVCFPVILMGFLCMFMTARPGFSPVDVLNSPLLVIVFIFIILSALYIDFWISVISAAIPAILYVAVSFMFIGELNPMFFSSLGKSVLMIMAGIISGLISKRIRQGVAETVESQNLLINELDRLVNEKTIELKQQNAQITEQKMLIEEKQKEILDSIHYARRIQNTLMPRESFIDRLLKKWG
jgi:hypothetical protein